MTTDDWTGWHDPSHQPITTTRFGWPQCGVCHAAPDYPDRWKYAQAADVTVGLYLPVADTYAAWRIAARSGVVGVADNDQIDAYYEGWLYGIPGSDPDANWRAAVATAANRLVVSYPTVARSRFPADSLLQIGVFSVRRGITVDNQPALDAWLA
jgi:hypothetical protein